MSKKPWETGAVIKEGFEPQGTETGRYIEGPETATGVVDQSQLSEALAAHEARQSAKGPSEDYPYHATVGIVSPEAHQEPEDQVNWDKIDRDMLQLTAQWYDLKQRIAREMTPLVEQERELRKKVIGYYFPTPAEGTNKREMPDGWELKYNHKLDRKIDEAALAAVLEQLPEGANEQLVRYKVELNTTGYRKLVDTHRTIFDEALIIKPGSPTLELVPPKPEKG